MISFLQNILQRHYKWLFSILLVVIIISFVFTIGAAPGIGRAKVSEREFYGFNLNSEATIKELSQAASLTFVLNTGEEPYSPKELEQAVLSRALFLSLADDLQIPNPTEQQLVTYIQKLPFFHNGFGKFDNRQYQAFLNSTQFSKQFSQGFIRQCLMQNYRIEQVQIALRGPAYLLSSEIENHVQKVETEWSIQVAKLNYDRFTPNIETNDEALKAFFEEHQSAYAIPEQYKVSYLIFDKERYMDKVEEPSDGELRSYYQRHFSDFATKYNIQDQSAGFERIKKQVRNAYVEAKAQRDAATAANQFLYELYDKEIERGSLFFNQLLKQHGLIERSVRSFSTQKLPEIPSFNAETWAQAFNLTPKNYYSNVAMHEKNAVILLLDEIVPQRTPIFEQVRSRVAKDYAELKKQELFLQEGNRIEDALATSLERKESFIKSSKKLGLEVESLENISLKSKPDYYNLITQIQGLEAGQLSSMLPQANGGSFVYVQKRITPEISQASESWDEGYRQLGLISQIARAQGSMAELISIELGQTEAR